MSRHDIAFPLSPSFIPYEVKVFKAATPAKLQEEAESTILHAFADSAERGLAIRVESATTIAVGNAYVMTMVISLSPLPESMD